MTIEIPRGDRELLKGVTELHVHAGPSVFIRPYHELELAQQAKNVGYKAILFKDHHTINADRAQLVQELVPDVKVFGGIVLNHSVGGLNPVAVETALHYGAKEIWMPSFDAANHVKHFGADFHRSRLGTAIQLKRAARKLPPIHILNTDREVSPEVIEILGLVADAAAIISSCHLSYDETLALTLAARKAGAKKMLVTHPQFQGWSVEDQSRLADAGATLEHCFGVCLPHERQYDPRLMAEAIKKIGAKRCVMASDVGAYFTPNPIETMRSFIRVMMMHGIRESDIRIMTKDNPARLLGID